MINLRCLHGGTSCRGAKEQPDHRLHVYYLIRISVLYDPSASFLIWVLYRHDVCYSEGLFYSS